jgi:hypothetical protein
VDNAVVEQALRSPIADFEDAVTVAAALASESEFIVTRTRSGFEAHRCGRLRRRRYCRFLGEIGG